MTQTVRETLIEAGTFRAQQIFTKKLIDHLTGYYSSSQSQFVINILVKITNQYGSKIEKAFAAFDISNLNLMRHFANATRSHILLEENLGDKQKAFCTLYNNLPKCSPTWQTIGLDALKPLLNAFLLFISVLAIFSILPVTNANTTFLDLGTTQISTKMLYEHFSIGMTNNYPKGHIIRFKEVTLRWLHGQYIREIGTSTLGTKLEFRTDFCATQEVDVPGIINALKTRQSLHNLYDNLSSLLYYSS